MNEGIESHSSESQALGGIPAEIASSVERVHVDDRKVQIDTAGDLAPALNWLASLPLHQVRIEPLGLHTVYQSVHLGRSDVTTDAIGSSGDEATVVGIEKAGASS